MTTDLVAAIKQIASERNIDANRILEVVKTAISSAYRKDYPEESGASIEVEIDEEAGTLEVYADKKVVDEVTSPATQISLKDAQKLEPKLKEGDHVLVEITDAAEFGRVAAQTVRQVMLQGFREVEKETVIEQFEQRLGGVETAAIQRMDRDGNVLLELFRGTVKMPPHEQIDGEYYRAGDRIKVYLKKIHSDARGKTPIVSRNDPNMLRALFELEVPEIASGTVEIMAVAREAGSRSKVAVRSNAAGVDEIGACVGQRGARINAIMNELRTNRGDEKIDIISWDEDIVLFMANAIKPAEALEVRIVSDTDRKAVVIVDDDSLSLAIGKEGQNVRLAARLTGWYLDIQGKNEYETNKGMSKFELDNEKVAEDLDAVASPEAADSSSEAEETDSETVADEKQESGTVSEANEAGDIASLDLGTRTENALEAAGINSVDDLRAKVEAGEKIDGIGPKSEEDIRAKLGL